MSGYRNVITLILAICLMQAAASFLGVITPVGLTELEAGETLTGLIGALYSAGFMAGAWAGPALLGRYSTIRLYAAAAAITAVFALVMGMVPGIAAWGAARIMHGIGFGLLFASAESWLGQAVPKERRGDMMGFYYFLSRIAGLSAPFLAFGLSALDPRGLSWVSILLCLSLVTMCLTRQAEPSPPGREVMRLPDLFRLAPSAVIGCFLAGLLNTGTLALLPTWTSTFAIGGAEQVQPRWPPPPPLPARCWCNGRRDGYRTGWSGASWSPACRFSPAPQRWRSPSGRCGSASRLCWSSCASGVRAPFRSTGSARLMRSTGPVRGGSRR